MRLVVLTPDLLGAGALPVALVNYAEMLGFHCIVHVVRTCKPCMSPVQRLYRHIDRAVVAQSSEGRRVADPSHLRKLEQSIRHASADAVIALLPIEEAGPFASAVGAPVLQARAGEGRSIRIDYRIKLESLAHGNYASRLRLLAWSPGESEARKLLDASARPLSGVSVTRNDAPLDFFALDVWKACLERFARDGVNDSIARAPSIAISKPKGGGALALMRVMQRQLGHRRRISAHTEVWEVGVRRRSSRNSFLSGDAYTWLQAPQGKWLADPFIVDHGDGLLVFVEEFDCELRRGAISCVELDSSLRQKSYRQILACPYHLSYPQIIECGGEYFMIPESGGKNTVELYRARDFPGEWELVRVLQEGPYFDTTVYFVNNQYWFFTSYIPDPDRAASQLLLFTSDTLDGEWRPHPASPLSMDASVARSAGAFFEDAGKLVRPAQDCSRSYGGGLNFQVVELLEADRYHETRLGTLAMPSTPVVDGAHTYNRCTNFEAIDRLRQVPRQP